MPTCNRNDADDPLRKLLRAMGDGTDPARGWRAETRNARNRRLAERSPRYIANRLALLHRLRERCVAANAAAAALPRVDEVLARAARIDEFLSGRADVPASD